jgi:hypothetical protein
MLLCDVEYSPARIKRYIKTIFIILTLDYNEHEAMWIETWHKCQWLRHTVHRAWKCVWESLKEFNSCPDSELNFYFHLSDTLTHFPKFCFLSPRQI